jgi:hypothetical protein
VGFYVLYVLIVGGWSVTPLGGGVSLKNPGSGGIIHSFVLAVGKPPACQNGTVPGSGTWYLPVLVVLVVPGSLDTYRVPSVAQCVSFQADARPSVRPSSVTNSVRSQSVMVDVAVLSFSTLIKRARRLVRFYLIVT